MTVISSNEFAANQQKYFNLAIDQEIYVKNGDNMFTVSVATQPKKQDDYFRKVITVEDILEGSTEELYADASEYEEILEPDEDFYSAISMEEVRERLHRVVDKLYANP